MYICTNESFNSSICLIVGGLVVLHRAFFIAIFFLKIIITFNISENIYNEKYYKKKIFFY